MFPSVLKTRLKALRWKSIATEAAIFLAIFLAISAWNGRHVVSGAAPAFTGALLDGTAFSSASLGGRPAVIHFWATWCGVCQAEQGNVEALAKGGDVVTVASSSGEAEAVRAFMKKEGLTFPVVLDPDGALAKRFGVSAFPTTLYVTADGAIRFSEVGYTTTVGMRVRRWLAGL